MCVCSCTSTPARNKACLETCPALSLYMYVCIYPVLRRRVHTRRRLPFFLSLYISLETFLDFWRCVLFLPFQFLSSSLLLLCFFCPVGARADNEDFGTRRSGPVFHRTTQNPSLRQCKASRSSVSLFLSLSILSLSLFLSSYRSPLSLSLALFLRLSLSP